LLLIGVSEKEMMIKTFELLVQHSPNFLWESKKCGTIGPWLDQEKKDRNFTAHINFP
jgi:hypothetical protein